MCREQKLVGSFCINDGHDIRAYRPTEGGVPGPLSFRLLQPTGLYRPTLSAAITDHRKRWLSL